MPITPQETKDAHKLLWPAQSEFQNRQLYLFQDFLTNTDEERNRLSNLIDLWDNVPRYSVSRQAMTKTRIKGQFLEHHVADFQYLGKAFTRTLYPARVKDLDGMHRDFYASANEELVEHALRKLAVDQQAGYFDKTNYRSGVVFTLYQLRDELHKRGHTRSFKQIVLALHILNGSTVEIHSVDSGELLSRSTYLPYLAAVSRANLLTDPKAKWLVQFHPLITGSIDTVTYRQYNYHLMMSHSTQLARWLHMQLVIKYTFASLIKPFETRYSTIKRDSRLLDHYGRVRDAIDQLGDALEELKAQNVLSDVTRRELTGPRGKLLDVVFTLLPSMDFIGDTKAASKRLNDARAANGSSQKALALGRGAGS
jgi:hypothetical protein